MLGILYRAYKDSITSDLERSKKVSALRSKGRFLEAYRLEDQGERNYRILFGSISIRIEDWLIKTDCENDARVRYLLGKLTQFEATKNVSHALGLINQATKALVLHPPFKDSPESRFLDVFGGDPDYILKLLHFYVADFHAVLHNQAFYLEYVFTPSINPANWDEVIKLTLSEPEETLRGGSRENCLREVRVKREIDEAKYRVAKSELELIQHYLIPWPEEGPMSWLHPSILKHERVIQDRLYDLFWPEQEYSAKNLEMYSQILNDLFRIPAPTDPDSQKTCEVFRRYLMQRKAFFEDGWAREPLEHHFD
jgi:hypothetical protein